MDKEDFNGSPARYAPLSDNPEEEEAERLFWLLAAEQKKKPRSPVPGTLLYIAFVLAAAVLICRFWLQPVFVDGTSMNATLSDRDVVVLDRLSYRLSEPERFDIIIFEPENEEGESYVKRIIGLPGEVVYISDEGGVYIADSFDAASGTYENLRCLAEDIYGLGETYPGEITYATKDYPVILGEDEYFVLGDNRLNSLDSRYRAIGAVKLSDMEGKVIFRLLPLTSLGRP